MSKEQVKAIETDKFYDETEKYVVYETKVAGFPVLLVYYFINNQCNEARYIINIEHSNLTDFVDDYKKLKGLLSKVYGSTIFDEEIWKGDLYKDDPEDYGMAIATGDLFYYSTWENDKTQITMELGGDNYKVDHFIIFYERKDLLNLANSIKEEEDLKGL